MLFQDFKKCCHTPEKKVREEEPPKQPEERQPDLSVLHAVTPRPSAIDQLMALEGLEDVKEAIKIQLSYSSVMRLRKEFGMSEPKRVFNILFTGDPGTGKTTVARLIGQIFHEHGLLSKGHTVETNRATLVGKFIGDSEANTTEKINEARGGVLMIDEIYALNADVSENGAETRDFGVKVIDTLMPVLSDPDSDLIVIGCGYKKQMDHFLSANPGLASRFPMVLNFPNLSFEQLLGITMSKLSDFDCRISEEAEKAIHALIRRAMTVRNFGNGRFATTLAESYLIPAMCHRIFKASDCRQLSREQLKELSVLEAADVPSFEKMFPLAAERQKSVGFK